MSKYVVMDLEMCNVCSANTDIELKNEIIQIGAVLLDENLEISDSFVTFVKPEYGRIDSYIEKLTGISQSEVEGAPTIKDAIDMLTSWMPEDAVLICWSANDVRQIRNECFFKKIPFPVIGSYFKDWVDCQAVFGNEMRKRLGRKKQYNLSEAIWISGVESDTGVHNALSDAVNTALLYKKLLCEDELVLSPYYFSENEPSNSVYNPFAELLSGIVCA